MCYPFPGPKCSPYLAKILTETKLTHGGRRYDNPEVWEAQQEYDASPAGMRELVRRIEGLYSDILRLDIDDPFEAEQRDDLEKEIRRFERRLAEAKKTRADQLRLIRAEDSGDIQHYSHCDEVVFPTRFHQFSEDCSSESEIRTDSKEIKKIIADSHRFLLQLNLDEIEAISNYTSYGMFGPSSLYRYLTTSHSNNVALETNINHIDNALAKDKRTIPLRVYRGLPLEIMENDGFDYTQIATYVLTKFPIGGTFTSRAFMSATLDYKIAKDFESSGIILEILAKTVGPVSNVSAYGVSEKEYILPRNLAYKVRAVKKVTNEYGKNRYTIQLEE